MVNTLGNGVDRALANGQASYCSVYGTTTGNRPQETLYGRVCKVCCMLQGPEADAYSPKCILVTGAAGFIASHVVIRLVKKYPDCKVSF